jgi:UDP-N-acetylmuramoylalanine--D-glutamate ligase
VTTASVELVSSAQGVRTFVAGLGTTGLSVARYLRARGEAFAVADTRAAPPALERLREINPEIELHLGAFPPELFSHAERVVVSPGLSLREPALQRAAQAGVELIGDIELFARTATAPVAAITGSNGKSTVTMLLMAMARQDGRLVRAGGNLGTPALDLIENPEPDLYVLELSSFQLETTTSLRPTVAVVLNVSADHMDRYADVQDYGNAKARIYQRARTRVVNRDDAAVLAMAQGEDAVSFGLNTPAEGHYGLSRNGGKTWLCKGQTRLLAEDELRIVGRHNTANALAALALGEALGLSMPAMCAALKEFTGLPHRMQWVAERDGVSWYNDSKGTNVGATVAALNGTPGRVVLIAGGDGKGADFTPLRPIVSSRVTALVLLGRDAQRIAAALEDAAPTVMVQDMEDAVAQAAQLARTGDCVLLSPACASLDMYSGYAERGEHFMSTVRRLLA